VATGPLMPLTHSVTATPPSPMASPLLEPALDATRARVAMFIGVLAWLPQWKGDAVDTLDILVVSASSEGRQEARAHLIMHERPYQTTHRGVPCTRS
jgi:hypothetical protein